MESMPEHKWWTCTIFSRRLLTLWLISVNMHVTIAEEHRTSLASYNYDDDDYDDERFSSL